MPSHAVTPKARVGLVCLFSLSIGSLLTPAQAPNAERPQNNSVDHARNAELARLPLRM